MNKLYTVVLIAVLSVVPIAAPVMASPANAAASSLGFVVAVENPSVIGGATIGGATIYDGDRLRTQERETMRVRIGGGQIFLRQNTATNVHVFPNGYSANLENGTIVASSGEGQTFQIFADGVTIRPASAQAASGQIEMVGSNLLILTGIHGTLEVEMGDKMNTVEAGKSYRLEMETDDPAQDQNYPRHAARGRRTYLWVVVPVFTGVTAFVIWRALISPCGP